MAAPFLLIALLTGVVQAQTTPPPDTSDDDGPPPLQNGVTTPAPAMPPIADPVVRPVVRPFEMPSSYQPAAPIAFAPQPSVTPSAAVPVEKYRGEYEAPADEQQRYYLMGVQGKFETEQSMMGALDGEWTVAAPAGGPLFTMVIDDAGGGTPVDGAWRDIRAGHPSSMGVIDSIDRDARTLKISFHSGGGDRLEPTVLTLTAQPDGRWAGEMNDAGATQPVVMNHAPIVPTQP